MTILDHRRPSDTSRRSDSAHPGGSVCTAATRSSSPAASVGALAAAELLRDSGLPVRDFSVEVREGIPYSSVFATMSMTDGEAPPAFADRMLAHPVVLAVDPS